MSFTPASRRASAPAIPALGRGSSNTSGVSASERRSSAPLVLTVQPVDNHICVCCRVRPFLRDENLKLDKQCLTIGSDGESIEITGGTKSDPRCVHDFKFDAVFEMKSSQEQIFAHISNRVLHRVLDGYNGSVFCYGQSSSGKTWTMEGARRGPERGIIPRAFEFIFDRMEAASESTEFALTVSMVEVYMEKILDLLGPSQSERRLSIAEHPLRGLCVQGASEPCIASLAELQSAFELGVQNRTMAFNRGSVRSGRSHSILSVFIQSKHKGSDSSMSSSLNLVDLAGSAKVKKTQANGQGTSLAEAKNINLSLSTLGMVINALASSSGHVPYRDSKLTRILQDSLGGNSNTAFIVTLSPSKRNAEESLSSLRFGERAQRVKQTAHANLNLNGSPADVDWQMFVNKSTIRFIKSTQNDQGPEGEAHVTAAQMAQNWLAVHAPPRKSQGSQQDGEHQDPQHNETAEQISRVDTSSGSTSDSESDSESVQEEVLAAENSLVQVLIPEEKPLEQQPKRIIDDETEEDQIVKMEFEEGVQGDQHAEQHEKQHSGQLDDRQEEQNTNQYEEQEDEQPKAHQDEWQQGLQVEQDGQKKTDGQQMPQEGLAVEHHEENEKVQEKQQAHAQHTKDTKRENKGRENRAKPRTRTKRSLRRDDKENVSIKRQEDEAAEDEVEQPLYHPSFDEAHLGSSADLDDDGEGDAKSDIDTELALDKWSSAPSSPATASVAPAKTEAPGGDPQLMALLQLVEDLQEDIVIEQSFADNACAQQKKWNRFLARLRAKLDPLRERLALRHIGDLFKDISEDESDSPWHKLRKLMEQQDLAEGLLEELERLSEKNEDVSFTGWLGDRVATLLGDGDQTMLGHVQRRLLKNSKAIKLVQEEVDRLRKAQEILLMEVVSNLQSSSARLCQYLREEGQDQRWAELDQQGLLRDLRWHAEIINRCFAAVDSTRSSFDGHRRMSTDAQ